MFYDSVCEHFDLTYQLDYISTEADSSDGSEECLGYAPSIPKYKT